MSDTRRKTAGRRRRGEIVVGRRGGAGARGPVGDGFSEELARDRVPDLQRARIVSALVEVARERGAPRVTVAHIVARSGVSRRTFYEMFADRDACFLAAFDNAVERASRRMTPAFRQKGPWRVRVRAGMLALLEFLDEEPGLGGLCIVDALGAGPRVLKRRTQVLSLLIDAVDEGCAEPRASSSATRLTAEGVVGGVLSVLYARLAEGAPGDGQAAPFVTLLNPLTAMIVLPYMGANASARELARPTPATPRRAARPRGNPLEGLDMRLTYRTLRVLSAIACAPGANNRQIAEAAGVADQGQISKLLARLERLALITNGSTGAARGEPNAWQLTARGHEMALSIGPQATPGGV